MDRVPPDQSPASRSAVKSACISSNGVCEAGRSEGAGRVIEPRNSVVVVIGITALGSQRGKADGLLIPEGSSLGGVMAMSLGHHRGLRAGHALTGATRELGRADCLPPEMPEVMGHRLNKGPGVGRVLRRAHRRAGNGTRTKRCRPGYRGTSEERRTSRWAVGSLSGA
jgi:hypothetical protein